MCIECANWQLEVWTQILEVCVVEYGAEWRGMVASRGKRSRCVGTSLPSTTRIHSHTLTLSHWDSASTAGLAQNIATVVMNDIYQDSIKQRK